MRPIVFISNRLIKLFGHSCKMLCYVFHFFFPNKRFTIPKYSKALFKARGQSKIPKILWQTNFTNHVTLPVYLNYLFNRLLSPTYEYRFMSTRQRESFIKTNYSKKIFSCYRKLNIGASQADFWRILVLNFFGGVYMDIDAHLTWPLELMIKRSFKSFFVKTKPNHYTNNFFASKKNNPFLISAITIVLGNINSKKHFETIYDITGPPILNAVLESKQVNYRNANVSYANGCFTNEYFQYIDKKEGKWTHANKEDLIAD